MLQEIGISFYSDDLDSRIDMWVLTDIHIFSFLFSSLKNPIFFLLFSPPPPTSKKKKKRKEKKNQNLTLLVTNIMVSTF